MSFRRSGGGGRQNPHNRQHQGGQSSYGAQDSTYYGGSPAPRQNNPSQRTAIVEITGHDPHWNFKQFQHEVNQCFSTRWMENTFAPNSPSVTITVDSKVAANLANRVSSSQYNNMRARVMGSGNVGSRNTKTSALEQQLQAILPQCWDPTNKILLLSDIISRVPGFTFTPANVETLVAVILPYSEAKALDLSRNNLTSLRSIISLLRALPSLDSLCLSDNGLPSPSRLLALSPFKAQLRNLIIANNPFTSRVQPALLAHHIAQLFPALETLDQQPLTPALLFALPPSLLVASRLPAEAGSYVAPNEDAHNAARMLPCFLRVFDNRLPTLQDFFLPTATLSISVDTDASSPQWLNAMYGSQHATAPKLYRGTADIKTVLGRTPRCVHDVEGLTVTAVVTRAGVSMTGSCAVMDLDGRMVRRADFTVVTIGGLIACLGIFISGGEQPGNTPIPEHPPIDSYGFLLNQPQYPSQTTAPAAVTGDIPAHVIAAVQALPIGDTDKHLVAMVMVQSGCGVDLAMQALQHFQGDGEKAIAAVRQQMGQQ